MDDGLPKFLQQGHKQMRSVPKLRNPENHLKFCCSTLCFLFAVYFFYKKYDIRQHIITTAAPIVAIHAMNYCKTKLKADKTVSL